ncbi:hypothetical protein PG984_015606 [Apiospora sp. TS-2023a]
MDGVLPQLNPMTRRVSSMHIPKRIRPPPAAAAPPARRPRGQVVLVPPHLDEPVPRVQAVARRRGVRLYGPVDWKKARDEPHGDAA